MLKDTRDTQIKYEELIEPYQPKSKGQQIIEDVVYHTLRIACAGLIGLGIAYTFVHEVLAHVL